MDRKIIDKTIANALAKVEKEDARLASLPSLLAAKTLPLPRYLPMQYSHGKESLYVRACFVTYYDYLMQVLNTRLDIHGMIVTGTPGIGKSVFMAYCFLRFRLENPTATMILKAFDDNSQLKIVMVWRNGAICEYVEYDDAAMSRVLLQYADEAAIVLIDGPPGLQPSYKFFVSFSSPAEKWLTFVEKEMTFRHIFMPVWDVDELRDAAHGLGLFELLHPLDPAKAIEFEQKVSENPDVIEARLYVFGGVARACLEVKEDFLKTQLQGLEAAILKLQNDASIVRYHPLTEERHRRLLRYLLRAPNDYDDVETDFVSSYVKARMTCIGGFREPISWDLLLK